MADLRLKGNKYCGETQNEKLQIYLHYNSGSEFHPPPDCVTKNSRTSQEVFQLRERDKKLRPRHSFPSLSPVLIASNLIESSSPVTDHRTWTTFYPSSRPTMTIRTSYLPPPNRTNASLWRTSPDGMCQWMLNNDKNRISRVQICIVDKTSCNLSCWSGRHFILCGTHNERESKTTNDDITLGDSHKSRLHYLMLACNTVPRMGGWLSQDTAKSQPRRIVCPESWSGAGQEEEVEVE